MTSDIHAAGPVDQGEWLQTRPGERCLIRVAAAETNGAYSVVEILSHSGDSTPIHVHQNEDEHFLKPLVFMAALYCLQLLGSILDTVRHCGPDRSAHEPMCDCLQSSAAVLANKG